MRLNKQNSFACGKLVHLACQDQDKLLLTGCSGTLVGGLVKQKGHISV